MKVWIVYYANNTVRGVYSSRKLAMAEMMKIEPPRPYTVGQKFPTVVMAEVQDDTQE